jgi:hypothetical protein
VVLSLQPSNKFALYDLGILQEDAGRNNDAILLYMRALSQDPRFALAQARMARLMRASAVR